MKTEYNLHPAWAAILEVYNIFADICKRHNLRMWVSSGNVLGAVRHKGFIPWDDDLDVMMPREDYERFVDELSDELPAYLKIVNRHNTPEFTLPFSKVQDTRREVVSRVESAIGRPMPQGIYIDIFPLDGCVPGKSKLYSQFWTYVYKFRRAWICRRFYPPSSKNKYLFVLGFLCGIFTPKTHTKLQFDEMYERLAKEFPFDGSPRCTYYEATYNRCRHYPRAIFDSTVELQFEDIKVPVPGGYEEYLICEYGPDYMTPPPPEKRISNHENSMVAAWKYGPTSE